MKLKGPTSNPFSIRLSGVTILLSLLINREQVCSSSIKNDNYHTQVLDHSINLIFNLSNPEPVLNFHNPDSLLSKILIPRPVESKNLSDCRTLFAKHFRSLSTHFDVPPSSNFYINSLEPPSYSPVPLKEIQTWALETHGFKAETPHGTKNFENQIFTHDPTAPLRLVLAAHIDSKYFPHPPDSQFVGATDSAAPVAIILEIAKALTPLLNKKLEKDIKLGKAGMTSERITLQIILLDGEEAFEQWSDSDSLYGARALATKWTTPLRTPTATQKTIRSVDQITTLILYDLIGSSNPQIRNFFDQTNWLFDSFQKIEDRLHKKSTFNLFHSYNNDNQNDFGKFLPNSNLIKNRNHFFVKRIPGQASAYGSVQDDHLPFLAEGVPILHLIATPFPHVWHTIHDDATALDLQTILEWNLISQVAIIQYLGLETFLDGYLSGRRDEL
ncbi:hypothetical protein MJO29_000325 [Puccinia striiformis f. sp. tritici]|nr:hypothetical protein Pst134EA_000312 [Puccinia striiformis f. sp. tritici]KAI9601863.1 hypothetical protein KEM48_001150 [Puccinia striiformis f. sp. tritici PST-130]KNF01836.1 hypothetical protein PSTG_04956 [Puccinia striiformis f. sp. tritici PST-78]KAH9466479.1 hypothetical protein Pst134EB_001532 [Puccinia striiformis f. sp. tritici]KAH9473238.1 hypothetical protein Pst134EA_000312 [Puccinia striiformis f. sp. tritici]KAI7967048.1 hypothetical protein MJO29_000325 [Puccinia striiformis